MDGSYRAGYGRTVTTDVLTPGKTALILVDLQTRVVALPTEPYSSAEVVARCGQLATAFRAANETVGIVQVRPKGTSAADNELVAEATPQDGDIHVFKPAVGGFSHTDLDAQLRARGITTLVLGGIATNFGVESTARSAYDLGYRLVFVRDAMTGLDQIAHDTALDRVFPRFGTVLDTESVLAALKDK